MYTEAFNSPAWTTVLGVVIIMAMLASSVAALYFIWKEIQERSASATPTDSEEENIKSEKMFPPEETHYPTRDSGLYEEYPMKLSFDDANPRQMDLPEPTPIYVEGIEADGSAEGSFFLNIQEEQGDIQDEQGDIQEEQGDIQDEHGSIQDEEGGIEDEHGSIQDEEGDNEDEEGDIQEEHGSIQDEEGDNEDEEGDNEDEESSIEDEHGDIQEEQRDIQDEQGAHST
jgi:hypothetical protein